MTYRVYLFVFNEAAFTRDELKEYLNNRQDIISWFFNMPNSIFLVTTSDTLNGLANDLNAKYGEYRYFFVRINSYNYGGRIPNKHWDLLKKYLPEEK